MPRRHAMTLRVCCHSSHRPVIHPDPVTALRQPDGDRRGRRGRMPAHLPPESPPMKTCLRSLVGLPLTLSAALAQQPNDFAAIDGQADVIDDAPCPIALCQVLSNEHTHRSVLITDAGAIPTEAQPLFHPPWRSARRPRRRRFSSTATSGARRSGRDSHPRRPSG